MTDALLIIAFGIPILAGMGWIIHMMLSFQTENSENFKDIRRHLRALEVRLYLLEASLIERTKKTGV